MAKDKQGNWFARHKVLTVILVFIVLGVIVSAAGGSKTNSNDTTDNKTDSAKTDDPAKVAKIGEAAQDGKFEFTVNSSECGKTSVGANEFLTSQAQGQFCLVDVTVKNIGSEAQTYDSSSQYLFDATDAKYSADNSASFNANPQGSTFLNQINPGNSVTGKLVFDLPKDKTPVRAELHDSTFSSGVKVNLQ